MAKTIIPRILAATGVIISVAALFTISWLAKRTAFVGIAFEQTKKLLTKQQKFTIVFL